MIIPTTDPNLSSQNTLITKVVNFPRAKIVEYSDLLPRKPEFQLLFGDTICSQQDQKQPMPCFLGQTVLVSIPSVLTCRDLTVLLQISANNNILLNK
jgi:hypothetical protein